MHGELGGDVFGMTMKATEMSTTWVILDTTTSIRGIQVKRSRRKPMRGIGGVIKPQRSGIITDEEEMEGEGGGWYWYWDWAKLIMAAEAMAMTWMSLTK